MPIVYPKFTGQPLEVEQGEADVLAAQGLLLDKPLTDAEREPVTVTVVPKFTGRPMQVDQAEADSLAEQGLLMGPEPATPPAVTEETTPADPDNTEEKQS